MKLITMALVCLLVAGMWLQDVNSRSLLVPTPRCCFKFLNDTVHKRTVRCYRHTSSSCSHGEGVVFKMKRGREVCVSSEKQWVQDYLPTLRRCNKPT